jgi:hypothetical protein
MRDLMRTGAIWNWLPSFLDKVSPKVHYCWTVSGWGDHA